MTFDSNEQLRDFLIALSVGVDGQGKRECAETLSRASRFYSGSPSEFLHEASVAIRQTLVDCADVLGTDQVREVGDVLKQIDEAFKRIGGA
jgi:hypothetical protein